MTHPPDSPAARAARALDPQATRSGSGEWSLRCPAHDDNNPSLSLRDRPGGGLLVHCHGGCEQAAVIDAIREAGHWVDDVAPTRAPPDNSERIWVYHDADGKPLMRVQRQPLAGGKKRFNQAHWDQDGKLVHKAMPVPFPLYNLPALAARPDAPVIVCEGEKAADAAAKLFPGSVATTWPGGAQATDKADFTPLHGRTVTLWPDHDKPGRKAMDKVAAALAGKARTLRVVDVAALGDVPEKWDAADCDPALVPRLRYRVLPRGPATLEFIGDLELDVTNRALIPGLLDVNSFAVIYGASNSGKSFLAFELAATVARGLPFRGKPVRPGLVVYISAESPTSIRLRAIAYRNHRMPGGDAPLALYGSAINLLDPGAELDRLIEMIREAAAKWNLPVALVVIDTLARVMPGGDENTPEDMGAVVAAGDRICAETGATVLFIHHSGKDATRGARGHSSLRAATDTEIEVTCANGQRQAAVTKQRDGPTGDVIRFRLQPVEVGIDPATDEPLTTCLVEFDVGPATALDTAAGEQKLQERLDAALLAVAAELKTSPEGATKTYLSESVIPDAVDGGRNEGRRLFDGLEGRGLIEVPNPHNKAQGGGKLWALSAAGVAHVERLHAFKELI